MSQEFKTAYYGSVHWEHIRRARWEKDGYACVLCHNDGELHCHHVAYNLFAEELHDLMTVCVGCHENIHRGGRIAFPDGALVSHFERLSIACVFESWLTDGATKTEAATTKCPV